jgi:hypothetical protein
VLRRGSVCDLGKGEQVRQREHVLVWQGRPPAGACGEAGGGIGAHESDDDLGDDTPAYRAKPVPHRLGIRLP